MQTSANTRLINNALLFCSKEQVKQFTETLVFFRLYHVNVVQGKPLFTFIDTLMATHENVLQNARDLGITSKYPIGSVIAECWEKDQCEAIYS